MATATATVHNQLPLAHAMQGRVITFSQALDYRLFLLVFGNPRQPDLVVEFFAAKTPALLIAIADMVLQDASGSEEAEFKTIKVVKPGNQPLPTYHELARLRYLSLPHGVMTRQSDVMALIAGLDNLVGSKPVPPRYAGRMPGVTA